MSEQSCRILIVEDDSIVAADLESDLREFGHQIVGVADHSGEAIRLADETAPDLILMDIRLQGEVDGIDTALCIRRRRQTPIVFVTANSDDAILKRAKQAEPVGFITKPYRREELNATLTIALHQHGLASRLFDEHAWLKVMLGSIRDGVIATDSRGLVRYLNPEAEKLTGWHRTRAEGQPIREVYVLRTLQGVIVEECPLSQALRTGEASARATFVLATQSGEVRTIEEAATPILDEAGALAGAVAVFHDITLRQLAEAERERLIGELQRSNDELSRFAHAVAHDLRMPARTVGALSELLLRRSSALSYDEAHVLDMIAGAAGQMQTLVTSLLGFAQVAQGELNREEVHVPDLLARLKVSLHSAIEESGAVLSVTDAPEVFADPRLLERVLQNLIGNSIQYRRQDMQPVIRISGHDSEGGWLLNVADNGQGIPADALERVFEPLHRLHGLELPGSGLGLALCRTIVERHGGRIWAESDGLDKGATFRIFLPKRSI